MARESEEGREDKDKDENWLRRFTRNKNIWKAKKISTEHEPDLQEWSLQSVLLYIL